MRLIPIVAGFATAQEINFEDVFDHTCDATTMSTSIRAEHLAKLGSWGEDFAQITLNEGCKGEMDDFGNIIFSAGSLQNLPLECGTQYADNSNGKITFWNVVQYTPPNDGSPITRDADGLYNFSCIYDMSVNGQAFELSLAHKIIAAPVDTIWFDGQTAEGKFRATMELFQDEDYKNSFRGSAVTLSLEQKLYIDVTLEAADPDVRLKIKRCWATPSNDADARIRHTLILDGCPTDKTVEMDENPINKNSARWESQMFQFIDEAQVWLHCDIQACDSRKYQCETECDAERERREVFGLEESAAERTRRGVSPAGATANHEYSANILTVGPMRSEERYVDESLVDIQQDKTWVWIAVVGVFLIGGLVAGIAYTCKLRKESSSVNSKLNGKAKSNDWQLYGAPAGDGKENPLHNW